METFSALLGLCAGNLPVTGEFPSQRPLTRSFDVFFDLRLNKRLSKQSWGWQFDTPSRSLWRHCNVTSIVPKIRSDTIIAIDRGDINDSGSCVGFQTSSDISNDIFSRLQIEFIHCFESGPLGLTVIPKRYWLVVFSATDTKYGKHPE